MFVCFNVIFYLEFFPIGGVLEDKDTLDVYLFVFMWGFFWIFWFGWFAVVFLNLNLPMWHFFEKGCREYLWLAISLGDFIVFSCSSVPALVIFLTFSQLSSLIPFKF